MQDLEGLKLITFNGLIYFYSFSSLLILISYHPT